MAHLHASDWTLHQTTRGLGHGIPAVQVVASEQQPLAFGHDADDRKVHQRHAPSPSTRQWLSDKLWSFVGTQTVPAHVTILLCLVCVWAGASMRFGEELPVPSGNGPTVLEKGAPHTGGMHPVSGASRSLLLLSNEALVKSMDAASAKATTTATATHTRLSGAPTTKELQSVLDHFEHQALNASGFLDVRPAFPATGESGEAARMRVVPYQVISWYPRITYFPSFLTPAQTEHVVELAMKRLAPSGLAYRPGESVDEHQQVRTSTGCFMLPEEDDAGVLREIADKIASVTHLPVENGEAFNVLRYMPTQHYDSHMDSFDPKEYGRQQSQRIATFLMFLRAPEEGGETVFKREGERNANATITDWRGCSDGMGLKVKPKVGDAVLFWSTTPDMQLDPRALHGACPVVKGEKISMARWIRDKPFGPRRPRVPRNNPKQH